MQWKGARFAQEVSHPLRGQPILTNSVAIPELKLAYRVPIATEATYTMSGEAFTANCALYRDFGVRRVVRVKYRDIPGVPRARFGSHPKPPDKMSDWGGHLNTKQAVKRTGRGCVVKLEWRCEAVECRLLMCRDYGVAMQR